MTAAAPPAAGDTAALLRQRLDPSAPLMAMSAHNPLSAKLAAEAGFDAIWGSGFELSASYAVPDANILPMGVHLEMMRAIAATVAVPVIADIDTGFGNAVTVSYIVPQYAAAGVAAVVIEDKTFPKDSSLRENARQELVPVATFQGKIAAAIAAAGARGPLVIARTEALIAGLGQAEALTRAEAYAEAGAVAILIHSRQTTPGEIVAFCKTWSGRVPLVLVPTAYPQLTRPEIAALGKVGLIICGNHAIRSAVAAMRRTFARIVKEQGIAGVEAEIATVAEIFALQGDTEMRALEVKYLR